MRENAYDKGSRLLTEGRVIVKELTPTRVVAYVRGEGALYRTACEFRVWNCTCAAHRATCSHIAALKRISAIDLPEDHQ